VMIDHNTPHISQEERAAVDSVLNSGWIAQGPEVQALERGFTKLFSGGAACALSSGTAALFLTLKSLGAGLGVRVDVPSYACSALLNTVHFAGVSPLQMDVTLDTFCIDFSRPELDTANIFLAVNTFGTQSNIEVFSRNGRKVIEDCCHSRGSFSENENEANAKIFSFYVGWSQMSRIVEFIQRRQEIARIYDNALSKRRGGRQNHYPDAAME
jgi:perosamine synthetase